MRKLWVFPLLALLLTACNAKSATAPSTMMPSPLIGDAGQDAKSESLHIGSGTVTMQGQDGQNQPLNITVRGTSGLKIDAHGEDPNHYPCYECQPGTSYPLHTGVAMYGPVTLRGHDYQLGCMSNSCGNGLLMLDGSVTVPPVTATSPATTSAPFTLGGTSLMQLGTSPEPNFVWTTYPLTGSGTVTFTFQTNAGVPNVWFIVGAVFTFR